MNVYPIGDLAVGVSFQREFDEVNYQTLLSYKYILDENPIENYVESIVTFTELCIYFSSQNIDNQNITRVNDFLKNIKQEKGNFHPPTSRLWDIPVCYDGEDLAWVADYCQLSVSEVIRLHTAPIYKVYMIGFLPGFPYLGGLNEKLYVPRKASPRLNVKAGSVGLAGEQTGIYPLDSPGGWQLIGHSDFKLFEPNTNPPVTLSAGDTIKFYTKI